MTTAAEKRNILVVDDEPQITRVLKTTLSTQGYAIRIASDGDEALQVMKDWMPDLLITDLRMPHMNGLELCRYVRAKWSLPIIVLSVKGEEKIKVDALDAGADDYVTKPFSVNELLARVRAALRRASAEQQPASEVIELGNFRIDPQQHSVQVGGQGSASHTEGIRASRLSGAPSRQSDHPPCAAGGDLGRKQRRTARVSSRLCGASTQEIGAGRGRSALYSH